MMAANETELSALLFEQLQSERLVILHTIDAASEGPTSRVISWVYAIDKQTIRFAIDQRSKVIANLRKNPNIALSVFAACTVFEIKGEASIVTDELEQVPFKLTCADISIQSVRDAMFYGSRISVEPEHEKTYDKRAADKLDRQVYDAMKQA